MTTSVISSPHLPLLLNAEDTKRRAHTRARTCRLGTNSKNKQQLWGSCQLAWTEFHGNEPPFICGCASLLMFVPWNSRSPSRCWTNWCQSQLWRRTPVKRTINEEDGHTFIQTHFLSCKKSGEHLGVADLPADLRPDLRNYQSGLILNPTNGQRKQIKKQNGSFLPMWTSIDFLLLFKLNSTLIQEQRLQLYTTCGDNAKLLFLLWLTTKNGFFSWNAS